MCLLSLLVPLMGPLSLLVPCRCLDPITAQTHSLSRTLSFSWTQSLSWTNKALFTVQIWKIFITGKNHQQCHQNNVTSVTQIWTYFK